MTCRNMALACKLSQVGREDLMLPYVSRYPLIDPGDSSGMEGMQEG